jgi:hypothetical protein
MDTAEHRHFLDTPAARISAGAIAVLALSGIGLVWNVHLNMRLVQGPSGVVRSGLEEAPAVNPQFIQCRDQRVADVDRMLADGLIDANRHTEYKERAITTCAGQFPPDRGG